jgi:hypothetical protein
VLAVGQHDADYVDAYHGPSAWRTEAETAKLPLSEIASRAATLAQAIAAAKPPATAAELTQLRHQYLARQLESLRARVSMLSGTKLRFDEESKALYDAVAPTHAEADFAKVLAQLDAKLPGQGPLVDRYDAFRGRFVITPDRLDAVFKAAIEACRRRPLQHLKLPPAEDLVVSVSRSVSRATMASRSVTSTTCCQSRCCCAIAAGWSSRSTRCSRRSR